MSVSDRVKQVHEILSSAASTTEIQAKLDALFPQACERTVEKVEEYSNECLEATGNPYRYQHCVTIENCPDPADNMARTCGQWRCVGA